MAMITFSGYPSSGKSTRAKELSQFLESKLASPSCSPSTSRLKVVIINDESLGISKGSYDGAFLRSVWSEES
jgi:protein KTI12